MDDRLTDGWWRRSPPVDAVLVARRPRRRQGDAGRPGRPPRRRRARSASPTTRSGPRCTGDAADRAAPRAVRLVRPHGTALPRPGRRAPARRRRCPLPRRGRAGPAGRVVALGARGQPVRLAARPLAGRAPAGGPGRGGRRGGDVGHPPVVRRWTGPPCGPPPVIGRDRWWDSPHSALLALRGRADVRTDRANLVVLSGPRRDSVRAELALVTLVESLRTRGGDVPGRVVGWWPDSGHLVRVEPEPAVLTLGAEAVALVLGGLGGARSDRPPERAPPGPLSLAPPWERARTSGTWPSWPTSTTARRPWSTPCSARPARSAPTRSSPTGSWTRATSSGRRASPSWPRTRPCAGAG